MPAFGTESPAASRFGPPPCDLGRIICICLFPALDVGSIVESMTSFTPHQERALSAAAEWLNAKPGRSGTPQVFRLFGFAGTGKTTLARHIAEAVNGEVKYAAFTGKAALVMRNKGCESASTIHSLIYRARETGDEQPSFELWDDAPASKAKLIIIDECSMVDAELGRDLLSFGAPLLVLGDPAQLPPIQGAGFFTNAEPDAMLTEVHRQARNDPIVRLSMDVRENRALTPGQYGETEVIRRDALDPDRVMNADQVLVGRNNTRRAYNMRIREKQDITDPLPVAGDKLVCLRNNRKKALFNGGLWRVKARAQSKSRIVTMRLTPDEEVRAKPVKVSVRGECFAGGIEDIPWEQRKPYDEFDYGYVLTVHKSQGSQWDDVVLFDESFAFPDARARWLYTGITRAAKRLSVVI
jgi:exodeoxyribonuclease-5